MQFYKENDRNNKFIGFIGDLIDFSDIEKLDNSCVAIYDSEQMRVGNITITKQNNTGFVSVKHIKECVAKEKRKINQLVQDIENRGIVRDLLEKHNTTIREVKAVISNLISGQRMDESLNSALDAVEENQKTGIGNWFIFLNVNENLI